MYNRFDTKYIIGIQINILIMQDIYRDLYTK